MLETSARLLRLLSLFQGRRYWTGADLAARLEVTTRTVRRDVDKLRTLGYPIHSTAGLEGGYQLGAGATMPPLLLDDNEVVAVAVGLQYAASGAFAGVEEASLQALVKIEQLMPPRLIRQVAALRAMIVRPDPSAVESSAIDAGMLSIIAAACRENSELHFRYRDHGGTSSVRAVEPHRIVNAQRRWYLVAWDATRKGWRTFRVDRIDGKPKAGGRYIAREPLSQDLATYVLRGVWGALKCRARIKLLVSAEDASARVPPAIGMIEPIDETSCMFDVSSQSFESMAMHLVLLGVDFVVHEPAKLVAEVRRVAGRYQRATRATTALPEPRPASL